MKKTFQDGWSFFERLLFTVALIKKMWVEIVMTILPHLLVYCVFMGLNH